MIITMRKRIKDDLIFKVIFPYTVDFYLNKLLLMTSIRSIFLLS